VIERNLSTRRPRLVRNCARGAGTHSHKCELLASAVATAFASQALVVGSRLSARYARLAGTTKLGVRADGEAHGSASTAPTNADGQSGRTEDDWNPPRTSGLGRIRGIPARTPRMGRRDPNDGRAFASAVASCVIPFQETREFVAIEPPPARVQAGEEFEFVACGKRHVGPIAKCHFILCMPANCRPL
jgi:hypothetical protein